MSPLTVEDYDPDHAEKLEWLWRWRLAKNTFNVVIGEGGVGKGTLTAWMLSTYVRGRWGRPGNAAIIGYEDSFRKVWIPRLASVDTPRGAVKYIARESLGSIILSEDLNELADVLKKHKVKLLYIDQLLDNLAIDADSHKQQDTRRQLEPLVSMSEANRITVVATMHPNKKTSGFREWQAGSAAFINVARVAMALRYHPDDEGMHEHEKRRVLIVAKSNYGSLGHAMEFKIRESMVRSRNGNGVIINRVGHVVGRQQCDMTVDELFVNHGENGGERRNRQRELERLLKSTLETKVRGTEVLEICDAEGYGERMVRRAASRIGVKSVRGIWSL